MSWPSALSWVNGLSHMPWWCWAGVPVLCVMVIWFELAQRPSRRAWIQLVTWSLLLAWGLRMGHAIGAEWRMPLVFWIVLVVALPFVIARHRSGAALAAWALSLCVCVAVLLDRWDWTQPVNDGLLAGGLAGWLACAFMHWVWPRHREPDAPPPRSPPEIDEAAVYEHLDGEQAQEGADKYTRE